ncbi:uncharacterized protein LOC124179248 [Neodiprion fabricii]|uniref:uncharacterized protein LOC124179248 n=1 Tax=Neodiprion fabricii TaxID=2872261 RepID=UPI001ED98491|nr:uncharacterized protein LOC124179248 [Neodiprion fabricii]
MSPVYPTLPRLAVRDSLDDEDLSDVDDEVFIRDGRNGGLKIDDEGGVKRPLMAPRRKCKISRQTDRRRPNCKALLVPCCYGSIALLVLLGLITLVIFAVSVFPVPLTFLQNWLARGIKPKVPKLDIAACTSLSASTVWTRSLPKLTSEAPLRSLDANSDNIDDIIVAFSTGLSDIEAPQYVCNVYFGGQTECLGGVLALDGTTGETIWTHWSWHVIFSLDCSMDVNGDEIKDCIAAGRGGTMRAISGRDGSMIWALPLQDFDKSDHHRILDVYDANYMADIDGDEVGDIIAAHTMQIGTKRSSNVVVVSGKTGDILHKIAINNKEQLFLAPQALVHPDGERILVIVTGSHEQLGGLYVASFSDLYAEFKLKELYHDSKKGILTQPVLADITGDGTEDIIVAKFNSTITAYDGRSFEQIWNYTVPNSEVISSPIPGYYNDDEIPDFMVKHQLGPGFPVYYYAVATILDGKSGKPLLENELQDSMSGQISGLSVTVDGYGNDWFLHWSADCLNHEGDRSVFEFLKTTSFSSRMGADLCKLRFNSTLSTKLLALSQHTAPPGLPIYISDEWKKLEYNNSIDPRKEAEKYSEMHPDYDGPNPEIRVSSITERSLRIHPSRRVGSSNSQNAENDIFADQFNYYPNSKLGNDFQDLKAGIANVGNNPETNVSGDFDSDEDWRDTNKWYDENKDYDLYDEGSNHDIDVEKGNGIREQRSDFIDTTKIGNYTDNVKNELDPNMDYTNGQTENNKYNRTTNVEESLSYPEFDVNLDSSADTQQKRSINGNRNKSEGIQGQEEIAVGNLQNSRKYERFFKINKRPNHELLPKKNEDQSSTDENAGKVVEARLLHKGSVLNVSILDVTEIRNSSDQPGWIAKIIERPKEPNGTEKVEVVVNEVRAKDSWVTRDIFSKVTKNNEEDANIEKIFKRESMKNRQIFLNNNNNNKIKSKREAKLVDSQNEYVDGVQRQPPTGILLPSLERIGKPSNSVDLVFLTSWLPPSDASVILLQQDLDCIHRKRKESTSPGSRGKNTKKERTQTILECLAERGIDYKILQEGTDRENVKIPLGQMTIYRMKLECVCPEDMLAGQTCRSISSQQSWPQHLGPTTNGYFKPLRKPAS